MNQEIERKFLISVDTFKDLSKNHEIQTLEQGYYVLRPHFHTRVRLINNREAFIASKVGSGMIRQEFEQPLELDHARLIFNQCERVLVKQRINVSYKGKTWDLDFFPEHGIAVAEIELSSETESFDLPPWIIKEVTGEDAYSNIVLASPKK